MSVQPVVYVPYKPFLSPSLPFPRSMVESYQGDATLPSTYRVLGAVPGTRGTDRVDPTYGAGSPQMGQRQPRDKMSNMERGVGAFGWGTHQRPLCPAL